MTVLEVIQRSSDFLARKGVETPRLQIELLLAHVLQLPRLKLYLNFERSLTEPELQVLREMVRRRGEREPLQHILGSTAFGDLEIKVNRDALIPRPETELLAEHASRWLSTLAARPSIALDFATGSGCLAITLAVKCPAAQVHALDVSPQALALARENAHRHGVVERIQFYLGDGLAAVPSALRFDLLVSNPPYIPSAEIALLQPEVRDYEPRLALDGGPDGMDFFRRLAREAGPFLAEGGRLMLEFGDGQESGLSDLFTREDWVIEAIEKDYSGRPRIFIAHRR
jgi:release factor glutamine methyltransferase